MVLERAKQARKRSCELLNRALRDEEKAKPAYETVIRAVRLVRKDYADKLERIKEQEQKHASMLKDIKRRLC